MRDSRPALYWTNSSISFLYLGNQGGRVMVTKGATSLGTWRVSQCMHMHMLHAHVHAHVRVHVPRAQSVTP